MLRAVADAEPDDVIDLRGANRAFIEEKIELGWAQSERGEFLTAAESRADMARRKADWLAARQG
jgi:hypothetical protein